ncbi:MAG: cAMP phosphodiesterase class-II:metallo-beta-lactamase superfamily protein [Planctomycetota bacterium]|nr:MAG: cAMP phosphodiesterase class-II:metallo-beta-lactamase superfamily protein [Planctomycetota bacterium]
MRLRVMGTYGAELGQMRTTSFLLEQTVLLDAGSATQVLGVEEIQALQAVVLTHAHVDHVKSLPLLLDARMGCPTLEVYAAQPTIAALRVHLFNGELWPDLESIPSPDNPCLRFRTIEPERPFQAGGLRFTAVEVTHTVPTVGYIVEDGTSALAISSDTAETERLWQLVRAHPAVRAAIVEVSYPSRLHAIAEASKHLSTVNLERELAKIPEGVAVYLTHLKPVFLEEILAELEPIRRRHPHVRLLQQDQSLEL